MRDILGERRYLGTWILVPELCIYQEGEPPTRGVYTITQDGREVEISIDWTARDGKSHAIVFGALDDGTPRPVPERPESELSITAVSALILDSAVRVGTQTVAYARRCASADGQLLSTIQQGHRQDGTAYQNFQVYRRGSPGDA
jgi:hypothetical protein